MNQQIRLDRAEIVNGRPFTNPAGNEEDMAIFWGMVDRLQRVLTQSESFSAPRCPFFLNSRGSDGCQHRIVLLNLPVLEAAGALTAVIFSGQKQPDSDPMLLDGVDLELIEELCQYPGIVSYSSRKAPNGNWVNMVLFSRPEAIEHWRKSKKHARAVRELSPQYYASIRLHKGLLPHGLASDHLILHRTKYYDYQDQELWRAIRQVKANIYPPSEPASATGRCAGTLAQLGQL